MSDGYEVSTIWPNGPAETRESSAEAAAGGYEVVAAMGGDGVAHHVANGLARTETALGIVPVGTTNVLARTLGIPGSAKKAAEALLAAVPTSIPLAHLATDSPSGARSEYATFAVGIGFDADVVAAAEQRPYSKVYFGGTHYAFAAVGTLLSDWRSRQANLRVECDGERMDAVTVLVQIREPYTYFGRLGLKITPDGSDGLVALAVSDLRLGRAIEVVGRAVLRRRMRVGTGVQVWTGFHKLVIEAEPTSPFQADGELLGHTASLEVTPAPQALRVLLNPPG